MKKAISFRIFEPVLVVSDLLCAMGAFVAGLWLSGWHANIGNDPRGTAGLIILGTITVSFFPTFRLYSHHVLFSKKQHFKNLIKAFFWSALTLGIVLLLFNSSDLLHRNYYYFLAMLVLTALGVLLLSRFFGAHLIDFLLSFGLAVFFVGVIGMVYQSGIPFFMTKEYLISGCFIISVLLVAFERFVLVHVVFNRWFRRHYRRQVVVVGTDNEAERIVSYICEKDSPYFVIGAIETIDSGDRFTLSNGKQKLGKVEDLPRIIKEYNIDDIIITDTGIDKPQLVTLLDYCTTAPNAWLSPQLMPIIDIKLYIDRFCGFPMILLGSQKRNWLFDRVKLLIDKLLALLALLLLSPVFLIIAVAVKIDSPGPVFYKPEVIGLNGTLFKMFKFRSMKMDSDNAIHKEYVSKLINGEIEKETTENKPLKITDDPRVTRVGCFIRKTSLDELPQLFNVLLGSMSLVGPRPCLPYEFAMYRDWQKKRTIVQPGITGLWQIAGRSEVVFEDMILLDFYYIFNRNIMLDFNIIFETIFVVLGRKGGY